MTTDDTNNSMDDEFDDDILGDEEGFEDFETGPSLTELWHENPIAKIGAIVVAVITIITLIVLFGGKKEEATPSFVGRGSDISAPPGTEETSPVYREAVEERNTDMIETARRKGTSSLPVPITPAVGRLSDNQKVEEDEDPLARWRRIQEKRQEQEIAAAEVSKSIEPAPDPHAETITQLAEAMAAQMQGILEIRQPKNAKYMSITTLDFFDEDETNLITNEEEGEDGAEEIITEIIIPAGDIEYAQLLIEANSDAPGPILGQIVTGPLAGSRILGSFAEREELLVLEFNIVVIDGISHPISTVALDPDTSTTGMATDVNHRYFKRIILPAAAAFVEGMGQAIAESGTTTVTVNSADSSTTSTEDTTDQDTDQEVASGVEEAASKISELIDEEAAKTKVLIRVRAGTPLGLLFLEPLIKETN